MFIWINNRKWNNINGSFLAVIIDKRKEVRIVLIKFRFFDVLCLV